MTIAIERDPIYRNRRFQSEIIELRVRWYLTYRHIYRDLVEIMASEASPFPLNHFAVGAAVCPRVREAVGSLCPARELIMEDG